MGGKAKNKTKQKGGKHARDSGGAEKKLFPEHSESKDTKKKPAKKTTPGTTLSPGRGAHLLSSDLKSKPSANGGGNTSAKGAGAAADPSDGRSNTDIT